MSQHHGSNEGFLARPSASPSARRIDAFAPRACTATSVSPLKTTPGARPGAREASGRAARAVWTKRAADFDVAVGMDGPLTAHKNGNGWDAQRLQ